MLFILWGGGAIVLGAFLGYLGYLYSKLAYSIFTSSLMALLFFGNYIIQVTGGDVVGAANVSSSGSFLAVGPLAPIMSGIDKMSYLPFHVQVAILIFAVTFFISRIATWASKSFGPKKPEETQADRRARVLKSYGMRSMDEVRNLR